MLRRLVDLAATLFEAAGTVAMAAGALIALVLALRDRSSGGGATLYRGFRHRLGRAIILGLELLVAADILRTITAKPTLTEVVILGMIVLIRTFLSFSLEVELDGRWPWQRASSEPKPPDEPAPREALHPSPQEARH
jgi:uncharacterized membrane protein